MKRFAFFLASLLFSISSLAETKHIESFRYAGPFRIHAPFILDTVDVDGKRPDTLEVLKGSIPPYAMQNAVQVKSVPAFEAGKALHYLSFSLETMGYTSAELKVEGVKDYRLFVDGAPSSQSLRLEPATHNIVIKALADPSICDSLRISIDCKNPAAIRPRSDLSRIFSLDINTDGESCAGVSISAGGKYYCIGHRFTSPGGKNSYSYDIIGVKDGVVYKTLGTSAEWMPDRDEYYYTRPSADGTDLVCCNPSTGAVTVIARGIPEGSFTISPKADYLVYSLEKEGPKEGEVHQILTPDDRQEGWRNRSYLARYDISTHVMTPLTFGYHNTWLCDISADGKKLLFASSRERLTKRPTQLYSYHIMDMESLQTTTVISDDGFVTSASFSPDARHLLLGGSAEAFGSMGARVKEGQIPNQFHILLYTLDTQNGEVKCLTSEMAPSVISGRWNRNDGRIYFSAEDKDCKHLFRMNADGSALEMLDTKDEYLYSYDMADRSADLIFYAQGIASADRVYAMDLKKKKVSLLEDISARRLENVRMGEGGAYEFVSSRGDLINGFYVLPPDFDPQKKYPMLVHYYGGCSPSARYTVGSYSPQYYAAQGYVFYVINPSGAAGMGQEFAARHVNTAGDVVSDDIIEGTMRFCEDHPFVDREKVGCFSASYGGFMTQLLLTKSDIYAAGISHAGISDHTSYWGEGYWGYSYSEVSMADSYPWTRKDLYVDRSPLFMADRINTPLLFLHGSADTNVPIGESIQMFTALKLLGRDTAFVVVDGENHGIRDYAKRRDWLRTISAWFAKYLKDDPSWWDSMYSPKNL